MGKIGLRDVRPVFQNLLIGFSKTVHKLFKFQEMFFFKQNYRLTIIHSQTLQRSCNSFKLPQESCYLYLFYLYRLSRHLNFLHTIQALIPFHPSNYPIPPQKPYTPIQYLHTLSKMYFPTFFFIYSFLKTQISTQTFHSTLSIVSHNFNAGALLPILTYSNPYQYSLKYHYNILFPSSFIKCSCSFLFIVPALILIIHKLTRFFSRKINSLSILNQSFFKAISTYTPKAMFIILRITFTCACTWIV